MTRRTKRSASSSDAPFRFDAANHHYFVGEQRRLSITQLLNVSGWTDDQWFTEEDSERGRAVHKLTADYDLGALTIDEYRGIYRGYLLGYEYAITRMRPTWIRIEEPRVHPTLKFAGTSDRVALVAKAMSVWDNKTGDPCKGYPIQTALQAILEAPALRIPPEMVQRYCCYIKPDGKAKVEQHRDRRDFDEAYRIIAKYAA